MTPDDLAALTKAHTAAKDAAEQARQRRNAAIVAAAAEGVRQVEIVRATGLTREQVRLIVRAST